MSTAMDNFERALDGLRKRGATGISLFVADGATDTIAADAVKMIAFMDKGHTRPSSEFFRERGIP
jgi:glutamate synthase domain-containing protein 1